MGECKLCGRDTSRTEEFWKAKFYNKWNRPLKRKSVWNTDLNFLCPHHAFMAGAGRYLWHWIPDVGEYDSSSEVIASFISDYLLKLAERQRKGKMLDECQAFQNCAGAISNPHYEGYRQKCTLFADYKRDGRFVCGKHSLGSIGKTGGGYRPKIVNIAYEDQLIVKRPDFGAILLAHWRHGIDLKEIRNG